MEYHNEQDFLGWHGCNVHCSFEHVYTGFGAGAANKRSRH
jgi:hypothetical protein